MCDRASDVIISGGVNIYPSEIEAELSCHPAVADVAVFGIPHDDWGEEVKAVVEPVPDIDLTGPPTDPGVSRMHAALIAEPDGSWTILDPGSENGTLVNGTEIAAGVRVPLHDGDRIHLGAWTAITVRAG